MKATTYVRQTTEVPVVSCNIIHGGHLNPFEWDVFSPIYVYFVKCIMSGTFGDLLREYDILFTFDDGCTQQNCEYVRIWAN